MGKEIKFRPATFYLGIADMLAREVEGQSKDSVDGDLSTQATPSVVHDKERLIMSENLAESSTIDSDVQSSSNTANDQPSSPQKSRPRTHSS